MEIGEMQGAVGDGVRGLRDAGEARCFGGAAANAAKVSVAREVRAAVYVAVAAFKLRLLHEAGRVEVSYSLRRILRA